LADRRKVSSEERNPEDEHALQNGGRVCGAPKKLQKKSTKGGDAAGRSNRRVSKKSTGTNDIAGGRRCSE